MTIKEMHYDFKSKWNKIDSQQHKNFKIPEIDWKLNEAQELFVKKIAKPRRISSSGFEISQRSIDDIRTIVVQNRCFIPVNNVVVLPTNYWHFVSGEVFMDKGNCTRKKGRIRIVQHDDNFEGSNFDKSSFEWRVSNATFFENGLFIYDDGTYINSKFCMTYIRKLSYIHNAEDFRNGSYNLPSGITLTGSFNCELPDHTHREIVDIAVALAANDIQLVAYQDKLAKLNLNEIV